MKLQLVSEEEPKKFMSDIIKVAIKKNGIKAKVKSPNGNIVDDYDLNKKEFEIKKKLKNEYKKGFEEGYKEANDKLKEKYESEVYKKSEEFYNILSSFEEKLNQYESSFDKIVKDISTAIAEKIIKREINKDSIFQDTLHETLPKIIGANKIVVKINPVELELLEKEDRIEVYEKKYEHIKFEPDEKIEKGGCLIETDIGNADARISSQINEIARQLENNMPDKSK